MSTISLAPGAISLAELRRIARGSDAVVLTGDWRADVERAVAAVKLRLEAGEALYGINTGFGSLCNICSMIWCPSLSKKSFVSALIFLSNRVLFPLQTRYPIYRRSNKKDLPSLCMATSSLLVAAKWRLISMR